MGAGEQMVDRSLFELYRMLGRLQDAPGDGLVEFEMNQRRNECALLTCLGVDVSFAYVESPGRWPSESGTKTPALCRSTPRES